MKEEFKFPIGSVMFTLGKDWLYYISAEGEIGKILRKDISSVRLMGRCAYRFVTFLVNRRHEQVTVGDASEKKEEMEKIEREFLNFLEAL